MSGRRGFLALTARAAAVGAMMVPAVARASETESGASCATNADADLLALCAEFHEKHAECLAFGETVVTNAEFDDLSDLLG